MRCGFVMNLILHCYPDDCCEHLGKPHIWLRHATWRMGRSSFYNGTKYDLHCLKMHLYFFVLFNPRTVFQQFYCICITSYWFVWKNFNFQINFIAVQLFTANRMYIIYSCLYISTFTLNPVLAAYADPLSNNAIIVLVFKEKYKKIKKERNVCEDKLLALLLMTAMKILCRLRTIALTSVLTFIHMRRVRLNLKIKSTNLLQK